MDKHGQSSAYIGSRTSGETGASESVQRLHEKADEFEEASKKSISKVSKFAKSEKEISEDELSKGWNAIDSVNWTNEYQNYGIMESTTEAGYAESAGESYVGAFTTHINTPGVQAFGSNYRQYNGSVEQDLSAYDPGGMSLTDYAPSGNETGDIDYSGTISAGATGLSLSIGIDYDVVQIKRFDESSPSVGEYGKWYWEYNENPYYNGPTTKLDKFKTSSIGRSPFAPSNYERIFSNVATAEWYEPYNGVPTDTFSYNTSLFYF